MTLSTFFYVRNIIMASSILSVPAVPGDATVFYTLELLSSRPEDELETLPLSERRKIGYVNFVPWMFSVVKIFCLLSSFSFICRNRKRERGNWWYGRGENTLAIQCYRRALDYLDEAVGGIQIEPDNAVDDPVSPSRIALAKGCVQILFVLV